MRARLAAARALDVAAGLLLAGILAAFVHPWVRPEDLFIALVLVGGLRLLLRPLPVPAFAPRRMVAMGTIAYTLVFSFVNHRTPYQAFVLPFLVLAAITGYARLRVARPRRARAGGARARVAGEPRPVFSHGESVRVVSVVAGC